MRLAVAGHQVRSATANAVLVNGGSQRSTHSWIGGQPEVIVAAKGQQGLTIDLHVNALRPLQSPPDSPQLFSVTSLQAFPQLGQHGGFRVLVGHAEIDVLPA